jgi:hypothetical protein
MARFAGRRATSARRKSLACRICAPCAGPAKARHSNHRRRAGPTSPVKQKKIDAAARSDNFPRQTPAAPSAATDPPESATDKALSAIDEASSAPDKASSATDQASSAPDKASSATDQPLSVRDKASVTTDKPASPTDSRCSTTATPEAKPPKAACGDGERLSPRPEDSVR